ncbi:MAG: response regulator [Geobacter sp.]|nr:response regulator [Geobacter sp.]
MEKTTRVLVIDDTPTCRKVTSAMLQRLNCLVDCAANGKEAAGLLDQNRYDLLLLDWMMPIMNGEELVRHVRDGSAGVHHQLVPIIVITADLFAAPRERCLQAGVNGYLPKPVDYEKLALLVAELMCPAY